MNIRYNQYDSKGNRELFEKVLKQMDENRLNLAVLESMKFDEMYCSTSKCYFSFFQLLQKFNLYDTFMNDSYSYDSCEFYNDQLFISIIHLNSYIRLSIRLENEDDFLLDFNFYKEIFAIINKYQTIQDLKNFRNNK